MYDHTDPNNAQLTGNGWSAVTFAEISGTYKSDFIEFYNANGGMPALLSWSSSNCCFSFPEFNDVQLTINVGGASTSCYLYPTIGTNVQCNPFGGYIQGTTYSFFTPIRCNSGSQFYTTIPTSGTTFSTTTVCARFRNPGIWRRCVGMFLYIYILFIFVVCNCLFLYLFLTCLSFVRFCAKTFLTFLSF